MAVAFLHLQKTRLFMIIFPNAKINLGLRIIEKRSDGYHSIETIFLPVDLCDLLEFVETNDNKSSLDITGIPVEGDPQDNLILKAWKILNIHHPIPPVHAHLHKIIPIGAGLGGGSADAAFMLKALNDYFSCGCKTEELELYASELGSDCTFFIKNVPTIGTGRGELLEPIEIKLSEYEVLLVNPGIHIGTREAYAGVTPAVPLTSLHELIALPIEAWQDTIINDFEASVFKSYPVIGLLKQKMIEAGAVYSAMSGSGSTVYGIFRKNEITLDSLSFDKCLVFRVNIKTRVYPGFTRN